MLKKLFNSVGIGTTTVNINLENAEFFPGEEVHGVINIVGGESAQMINGISINVFTYYLSRDSDGTSNVEYNLEDINIDTELLAQPQQKYSFPFFLKLPIKTPVTICGQSVTLQAKLKVENFFPPQNKVMLQVKPLAIVNYVVQAIQSLGFSFKHFECSEYYFQNVFFDCAQIFHFKPNATSVYKKRFQKIQARFGVISGENIAISLKLEVYKYNFQGLMSEILGISTQYVNIEVTKENINESADYWAKTLSKTVKTLSESIDKELKVFF